MIDRVQGPNYYGQSQNYEKKVKSNTETFSLDYRQQQGVAETKGKAKDAKGSVIENLLSKEEDAQMGVHLELTASEKTESKTEEIVEKEGLLDGISKRIKTLWKDIKSAFVKFWYGERVEVIPENEVTVEDTPPEDPVLEEHPQTQEEAHQRMLDALYEHGAKSLAKNSDLLTSYNKNGTLVQMDAGDKNRILHVHPHHIDEVF